MPDTTDRLLYLSRTDVESLCGEIDPVALVREVFALHGRGGTTLPDEAYLRWHADGDEPVRSLAMPAYLHAPFHAAGVKIINSNPCNPARGIPRASGLTLLFEPDSARIRGVMEGAYVSALRTAAVSTMAVELLSRAPACLGVIGAGAIGAAHIDLALRRWATLRRIVLFDRDRPTAEALARAMARAHPDRAAIEVTVDPEAVVRAADAIVAATTVTAGYIPYDWLQRGAVVVNVSLDDLLPDVFLQADLLFVDDWHLVTADSHRLLGRLAREGRVLPAGAAASPGTRAIDGELGDLVTGRHSGRRAATDIIVVNPFGLAIEDVAFAARIFALAQQRGRGTWLPV